MEKARLKSKARGVLYYGAEQKVETRAAGRKDEQTKKAKGCLRVELKNKQRHPAGRVGTKGCKHKKSISC